MLETFIIYREKYSTLTEEWRAKFHALSSHDMTTAKTIIESNNFGNIGEISGISAEVREVLSYYLIERG